MRPISLLPGLACDAELWRDQMAALAAQRPVRVSEVHTPLPSTSDTPRRWRRATGHDGQEMASLIPGARFELIDECGHMLTWERPQQVNALLIDWLARL